MATEADLIQKFKDLDIPVGADFEELIHAAFAGFNMADQISSEVNAKQDKIGYTPADDSKVVHNSGNETIGGTKTFTKPIKGTIDGITYRYSAQGDDLDTSYMNDSVVFVGGNQVANAPVGTSGTWAIVRNYNANATNGAQSYYDTNQGVLYVRTRNSTSTFTPWVQVADDSKVAHLSGAEEISGQKTFDVAPIDKTTGNPYIIKSDVTTAISAATANMADTTKTTNFTNGLQSGGVNVATAADIKSVKDSAWRQLDDKYIKSSNGSIAAGSYVLYRLDTLNKRLLFTFALDSRGGITTVTIDFSSVVSNISQPTPNYFANNFTQNNSDGTITVSKNLLNFSLSSEGYAFSLYNNRNASFCFVDYDKLV